ncbi:MAG: tyrosine--tRNA ligase [Candidatus Micrarchaeota archaeon]|nr:tyrosine--tRNA ligase [Candidatus Micrarchaeota archaeon]
MDVDTRLKLIKSEPLEEIITEPELRGMLETNSKPKHYIGLEISGMPHIGHILLGGKKINDFAKAGIETQVLLADWHTMANNKLGGDWEKIKKVAGFYRDLFSFFCPKTRVVLGSDLYPQTKDYWETLIQISRRTTMARATRMLVIEGRSEKDSLYVSQYIYPIMQTADIWALDVDLPHAGMDQRRVHVFAKETFKSMKMKNIVPLHHHLMPSLVEPPQFDANSSKEEQVAAMKMSKSKPGSFISILATESEVAETMNKAWCPEGVVDNNPVLLINKYITLPIKNELHVERKGEHGGDVDYTDYEQLVEDFRSKKLHPADLKAATARSLTKIMEPITRKFGSERIGISKLISS